MMKNNHGSIDGYDLPPRFFRRHVGQAWASTSHDKSILGMISRPVNFVTNLSHRVIPAIRWAARNDTLVPIPSSKTCLNILLGVLIMLTGAFIAHNASGYIGALGADTVGYAVHGIGLAPLLKAVEDFLWKV